MDRLEARFSIPESHVIEKFRRRGFFERNRSYAKDLFRAFLNLFRYPLSEKKRTQDFVKTSYDSIWGQANGNWIEDLNKARLRLSYIGGELVADGWLRKDVIIQMLLDVFKKLDCRSVLEVGAGKGGNLIWMALKDSSLRLSGLELSSGGFAASQELLKHIPEGFIKGIDVKTPAGPVAVSFNQGSALKMPFPDKSFDAAFTLVVLEQIPRDYPKVLEEMRRVSKKYCVFVEPFREANNLLGKLHLKRMDYFRASYKEFAKFGLKPILFFTDFPQKRNHQNGFLVAEVL